MTFTICDSNKRICNFNNKNFPSVNSAILGNSRPYNNDSSGNDARGPGFIPRRYLTATGSNIIKNGSNRHNQNLSAAPNPIKHWRKQLVPRENSGAGKASVSQIMDRPGGANYITDTDDITNINCIKTYIETNNPNPSCKNRCIIKPKRNSISVNDNYHTSTTSYLQNRVKTYDQKMTIQNISGNDYKNPPTHSSTGQQEYYSQYTVDQSGCFIDCSCVVSVIYKPSNIQFHKEGAISSNVYTFNLRKKTDNLCVLRNRWGLDNVCPEKYTENNYINTNINNDLCKTKTNNISKRYKSGGIGNHTVCFYTPTSELHQQLGGKLQSIRGTGTGKHIFKQESLCNICNQPRCSSLITRGKLRCKCTELTLQQKCHCLIATTEEYSECGYGTMPIYPPPDISINSPNTNSTINVDNVVVSFTTMNFVLGTYLWPGHIHVLLNSNLYVMHYSNDPITISNLVNGTYTIRLELVDISHQVLVPSIYDEIVVVVSIPPPPLDE